jgi:hypothetical protein
MARWPRDKRCPGPAVTHHRPVIGPPATLPGMRRQQRPQPLPFLIGQVMTFQPFKHHTDVHGPATKIHGTRPSRIWPAGAARNVASVRETLGLSGKRAVIKTLMTITLHFPGRGAATRSAWPRCKVAWRHPD